jgi:hypothetical protein
MPVPDFSSGEVLTAAAMDSIGLWLVKTQTVGTAVSSVSVTSAFSANYKNYRIIYNGGTSSAGADLRIRLGATSTGYYFAGNFSTYAGAAGVWNGANQAYFTPVGFSSTSGGSLLCDLFNPFEAVRTTYHAVRASIDTGGVAGANAGFLNDTTSYTSFELSPSTGTLTGGTIYVYGYRN